MSAPPRRPITFQALVRLFKNRLSSATYREILSFRDAASRAHFNRLAHHSTTNKKILLLGNCQVRPLATLMRAMVGNTEIQAFELTPQFVSDMASRRRELVDVLGNSDLIFLHLHGEAKEILDSRYQSESAKVRLMPRIGHTAFQPDMDFVHDSRGAHVTGPLGSYQSALIFFGWTHSLTPSQTKCLFCAEVYEALGYFEHATTSRELLLAEGVLTGLPLDGLIEKWNASGSWMHSTNHPKLLPLVDVARGLLAREGIDALPGVEAFIDDELASSAVWPVYPEIAERMGLTGHLLFKRPVDALLRRQPVSMLTLDQFIEESFVAFAKYPKDALTCRRLDSVGFSQLKLRLTRAGTTTDQYSSPDPAPAIAATPAIDKPTANPYQRLPDHRFWRRAIERVQLADVDPVINPRFKPACGAKIATAGSCFAQHVAQALQQNGLNYFVTEPGDHLPAGEAARRQYGVFSARYGNLYTARQLLQLFDRAYDRFTPRDLCWTRSDGRLIDPFRPHIEADGFGSGDAVQRSRVEHFAAVRDMFEQLDVFVFTLGLTEAWRNRIDGAVFPLAPGVVVGGSAPDDVSSDYEFVNFGVSDVVADMQGFIDRLRTVNSTARIILTVSPVPLIATYEDRHVLTATCYSKSVLRAAAEEIVRFNHHCDYFPSFEIITGSYNKGVYFESDKRSVNAAGVTHVMRLFLTHYGGLARVPHPSDKVHNRHASDIRKQLGLIKEVICDEETLDRPHRQ